MGAHGALAYIVKVLLLGPYPPPHGGVQIHLVALREYLRRAGVPTAVIDITRHKKAEGDEIYYPKGALALIALLVRLEYDVVHLHFGGDLTHRLQALTLVCTILRRRGLVLTFHSGGYPSSHPGRRADKKTMRGFVLRRLDRIIAVNQALVETFYRYGIDERRVRLIAPHAFRGGQTVTGAGTKRELPAPLGEFFGNHQPVLLTVGLLEPEYDLRLQIDMLEALRESHHDAGLVIIGSGSLDADLRAYIAAKPYSEHVLLCGDVPHAATLDAIARCDVMLRTTLYDGDSISVREALHMGTPVLATDNGMRPDGVHLFRGDGPRALDLSIRELLARNLTRAAPQADSTDRNLQEVLDLYRELA